MLSAEDAAALKAVLLKPSSYPSYVSACMFEPGIAFAIPADSDLMVLVCFKCSEVAFVKGRKRLEVFSVTDTGKQALLEISRKAYPDLAPVKSHAAED